METFDIVKLASYRENNRIEAKAAKGGLPRSMWETYSAFANTYGGVILLGVKEREDGTFETVGLTPVEAEHLRQDFWNTVSNRSKVSAVLPIESEVEVLEADGGIVLAIHVPRAPRDERPVYINNDLFGGTYRRRGEGATVARGRRSQQCSGIRELRRWIPRCWTISLLPTSIQTQCGHIAIVSAQRDRAAPGPISMTSVFCVLLARQW